MGILDSIDLFSHDDDVKRERDRNEFHAPNAADVGNERTLVSFLLLCFFLLRDERDGSHARVFRDRGESEQTNDSRWWW